MNVRTCSHLHPAPGSSHVLSAGSALRCRGSYSRASRSASHSRVHSARPSRTVVRVCNQFTVKEQSTGITFPEVTGFWTGTERYRCMGAGLRAKKFAFVPVKVYVVTFYVEADRAAKELGIRARGGFFGDSPDDFTTALSDGAFNKVLQVQLVRNVEGSQFYEALDEALAPRMRLMQDTGSLQKFGSFFEGRKLEKGTNILMLWRVEGQLEVHVASPSASDFAKVSPELRIDSASLCRALFEVYLGDSSVVPDAKSAWAQGAKALLATDQSKRGTDKGGAG